MEQDIIYVGLDVHKDTVAVALAEAGKRAEVREHGKLIFNTLKRQGVDCKRQSALEKRLGTTFWLLGGLGSVFGELPDGGRQSDAGGA